MRRGRVFYDRKYCGMISETDTGYRFEYDRAWLQCHDAMPVSLTLPLSDMGFDSPVMFPFFDGLIPEGWLLNIAVTNWKLDPKDRMGLLLTCCSDCIGAVSVEAET